MPEQGPRTQFAQFSEGSPDISLSGKPPHLCELSRSQCEPPFHVQEFSEPLPPDNSLQKQLLKSIDAISSIPQGMILAQQTDKPYLKEIHEFFMEIRELLLHGFSLPLPSAVLPERNTYNQFVPSTNKDHRKQRSSSIGVEGNLIKDLHLLKFR